QSTQVPTFIATVKPAQPPTQTQPAQPTMSSRTKAKNLRAVLPREIPVHLQPQQQVAKLDVFPSPSPLSPEEKLMLAYLRGTPRTEVAANSKPDVPPLMELNSLPSLADGPAS